MGMMRLLIFIWLLIGLGQHPAQAQADSPVRRIVLFLPLHLDSIFNAQQEFRYKNHEFPRFVSSPLEFYEGFIDALDSLKQKPGNTELHVIDSRSTQRSLSAQLNSPNVQEADLWLLFGNVTETRILAEAAKTKQIALINVNLPNDGGVQGNPFFFMWNSTLQTQIEGIYRHLQQYYALDRIVVVRKKGSLEDRILNHLEETGKNTRGVPLKYKVIEVVDSFSVNQLRGKLDSSQQTLLLGASLDEKFARLLASASADLKTEGFRVELMGMPTWENVREFATTRYRNLEIVIPTPYYYARIDNWSQWLQSRFAESYYSRPSDFYFRGYELAWLAHSLLQKKTTDLAGQLPGKHKMIFSDADLQPVLNRQNYMLDYFENKKLYFLKRLDGAVRSVR